MVSELLTQEMATGNCRPVDNTVVRAEVHEDMNFAEKIKGNRHFPFWWGEMIPFNTAHSLLQSETRSQGVVATIRNMKRANTGQININGLRLYSRCQGGEGQD